MKATGIVRRIDELGRIVVPKEIRKTLRIREGDPMEIFTDTEGKVVLKKYSPIEDITTHARQAAEVISRITGMGVLITDRDQAIAVSGAVKKELLGKSISRALEEYMRERKNINSSKGDKKIEILEGEGVMEGEQVACHILSDSDVIGSIVIVSKDKTITEVESKIALMVSMFLGRQLEG